MDHDGDLQRHWVVQENKWRASRWSLDAEIIVDEDGRLERLTDSIGALLERLAPVATRLRCKAELEGIGAIMRKGPGYRHQRQLYEETGQFVPIVDALVQELRGSVPPPGGVFG